MLGSNYETYTAAQLPAPAGTLLVGGKNDVGQRGLGYTTSVDAKLTAVPGLTDVVKVDTDVWGTTLALTGDGTLWAWGSNKDGMLGDGGAKDSYKPVKVPVGGTVVDMVIADDAEGNGRGYAVTSNGELWSWWQGHKPSLVSGVPKMWPG